MHGRHAIPYLLQCQLTGLLPDALLLCLLSFRLAQPAQQQPGQGLVQLPAFRLLPCRRAHPTAWCTGTPSSAGCQAGCAAGVLCAGQRCGLLGSQQAPQLPAAQHLSLP